MEFVDLSGQYKRIESDVDERIKKVLSHGKYIMGPEVFELEEVLADFVGVKECISVSSGTDALVMALMALGVGKGDEVITTSFSFIATGEAILLVGAIPVFIDIDVNTYNIDPEKIESVITKKTKAIIPVSLFGQCAEFDSINKISKKYNLPVIEDGAQSFGAIQNGRRSCGLTTIGCTSFFPSKPLGGYGDGGACFTDDSKLAKRLREIRVHGQDRRYHHVRLGVNGRLDTLQAAILLAKMKIFPDEVERRRAVGDKYTSLIRSYTHNDELMVPHILSYNKSVYAQYTIQSNQRDIKLEKLRGHNIPTAIHYPISLHNQPVFHDSSKEKCLISERASERVFSLPMHPYLSEEDQELIVSVLMSKTEI